MFTKRIIPCLDVNNGRVVKGVNFVNLRDAGDPVEIAAAYDKAGADELVFLDITATSDARETVVDMVSKVAEKVFIPFTVGGGIRLWMISRHYSVRVRTRYRLILLQSTVRNSSVRLQISLAASVWW